MVEEKIVIIQWEGRKTLAEIKDLRCRLAVACG